MILYRISVIYVICTTVCDFVTVQATTVKLGTINADENHQYVCGSSAKLSCEISQDIIYGQFVQVVRYDDSGSEVLASQPNTQNGGEFVTLIVTITKSGLYSCQYSDVIVLSTAFNVTITVHGTNNQCKLPGSFTTTTTEIPTTTSLSTIGRQTPGLNPLIYTLVSGLLLGVLILVSIVTCWIRSRKNNRLRSLLPQETPQDYLDYIQQGHFTPLTTSEFVASLRERPPTYIESEVLQRSMSEEETTTGDSTSPIPTRNTLTPIEEEDDLPREPLGNMGTTEGVLEHAPPITNEMLVDELILSLRVDQTSDLLEPLPLISDLPDDDGDVVTDSTETTNLLVGITPSINNAVV